MHRVHEYPGSFLPGMELTQCTFIARGGLICLVLSLMLISLLAGSAAAQISVTSPVSGATVPMPVWIRAHVAGCNGSTTTAIGYSIDDSPFTTWGVTAFDIDTNDYRWSSPGTYAIHFKAWAGSVQCPVVNSTVTVSGPTTHNAPNAQENSDWHWIYDTGTQPGTASGSTSYPVASPSFDSHSRSFSMNYVNGGGMRGSTSFWNDISATHFVYDTYVYLANPAKVQNLEMDTNQVWNQNGDVRIFGLQCATGSGTWEFTTNVSAKTKWNPSNVPCNLNSWPVNSWHHVQMVVHTTGGGDVYYDTVTVDGLKSTFSDAFGNSSYSLGWTPPGNLVLNFQIDGKGASGSVTAYIDGMTMISW